VYRELLNEAETAAEVIRVHWMMYRDGVLNPENISRSGAAVPLRTLSSISGPENSKFVDRDAPLRLAEAVQIAFPRGGITVSGLRREIVRGRLVAEEIAGKQFTTLNNIGRMRELCRVVAKDPVCGRANPAEKMARSSGLLKTTANTSPRDALAARLKLDRQRKR
jgi:hypothetical protein